MSAPIILDIEASGFGRGSYPIEIGVAFADGSTFCTLIRPAPEWSHWDHEAERVHGISPEILARHGRPLEAVAEEVNSRLIGQTVYSDGWANDYAWLNRLFDSAQMFPRFSLQSLRSLLSEDEAAVWHATKAEVQAGLEARRHRASADARVLQQSVLRVKGSVAAVKPAARSPRHITH